MSSSPSQPKLGIGPCPLVITLTACALSRLASPSNDGPTARAALASASVWQALQPLSWNFWRASATFSGASAGAGASELA